MSKQDGVGFALVGALVWLAATMAYMTFVGGAVQPSYALNTFLAAAALALFLRITARVRQTPQDRRAMAALAFSAPGLIGAALISVNFATVLPNLSPEALARYGALMLALYSVVLAQAIERPAKTA